MLSMHTPNVLCGSLVSKADRMSGILFKRGLSLKVGASALLQASYSAQPIHKAPRCVGKNASTVHGLE